MQYIYMDTFVKLKEKRALVRDLFQEGGEPNSLTFIGLTWTWVRDRSWVFFNVESEGGAINKTSDILRPLRIIRNEMAMQGIRELIVRRDDPCLKRMDWADFCAALETTFGQEGVHVLVYKDVIDDCTSSREEAIRVRKVQEEKERKNPWNNPVTPNSGYRWDSDKGGLVAKEIETPWTKDNEAARQSNPRVMNETTRRVRSAAVLKELETRAKEKAQSTDKALKEMKMNEEAVMRSLNLDGEQEDGISPMEATGTSSHHQKENQRSQSRKLSPLTRVKERYYGFPSPGQAPADDDDVFSIADGYAPR